MDILPSWLQLNDIPGHFAYIIFAISAALTNIVWLRVLAVLGCFTEIIYFASTSKALYTGIGWNVLFISIHLWRLWDLLKYRLRLLIGVDDLSLIGRIFQGLQTAQLARVLSVGRWRVVQAGGEISSADEPGTIFVVTFGRLNVSSERGPTMTLGNGWLIGETVMLRPGAMPAPVWRVRVAQTSRLLCLDADRLRTICDADPEIGNAVHRAIATQLAAKSAQSVRTDVETVTLPELVPDPIFAHRSIRSAAKAS